MASSSDIWKSISFSSFAIVLSLPLGIIIWIISLLAGISPPMNYTVNGYNLSFFSPLVLSGVFLGIINTSAFYRIKQDFKILNLNHNLIFGSLLNALSFVFLFAGNIGILLSTFINAVNIITVLLWIGFMILFVIFFSIGNLFMGLNLYKIGKSYNNLRLKNSGLLLSLILPSYVGYILLYLTTKPRKQEFKQQINTYPTYGGYEKTYQIRNEQTRITRKDSDHTRRIPLYFEKTVKIDNSKTISINTNTSQSPQNSTPLNLPKISNTSNISSKQQYENSNNVSLRTPYNNLGNANQKTSIPFSNIPQNYMDNKREYGILRGDGSLYVTLYANDKCYIVSVKLANLPYSPLLVQPQVLQRGYNQVYIKFDRFVTYGLVKEKSYKLVISLRTEDTYLPDKEINVLFQP